MKYYNVFNIEQTNFAEKHPERYERMKKNEQPDNHSDGMMFDALDELVYTQNWYCPIKVKYSDSAFMSRQPTTSFAPKKAVSARGGIYGTLLHEMAHSTGSPQRLNRTFGNFFRRCALRT